MNILIQQPNHTYSMGAINLSSVFNKFEDKESFLIALMMMGFVLEGNVAPKSMNYIRKYLIGELSKKNFGIDYARLLEVYKQVYNKKKTFEKRNNKQTLYNKKEKNERSLLNKQVYNAKKAFEKKR